MNWELYHITALFLGNIFIQYLHSASNLTYIDFLWLHISNLVGIMYFTILALNTNLLFWFTLCENISLLMRTKVDILLKSIKSRIDRNKKTTYTFHYEMIFDQSQHVFNLKAPVLKLAQPLYFCLHVRCSYNSFTAVMGFRLALFSD